MMAPPPSPPPKGGAWLPRYPYNKGVRFGLSSYWQPHRGNLTFHSPPYGGGATLSWDRNSAQKGSVNSVSSVREKPPQRKQKNSYAWRKQPNRGHLTYDLPIWNGSAGWWKILTAHQADHPQYTHISSPTTEDITHMKSACYVLYSSICPSCS